MFDFLKSDIGKVALGGAIAVAGQLAVTLIAWLKEAHFAARKKRKDAEYLALRLVLVFDGVVNACYSAVHDPLREDQEGISENTRGFAAVRLLDRACRSVVVTSFKIFAKDKFQDLCQRAELVGWRISRRRNPPLCQPTCYI
jgi:hypothetical protein